MAVPYIEATGSLTNQAADVFAEMRGRRGLIVSNNSDTSMVCRFGSAATATAGIPLAAGASIEFRDPRACPDAKVSLYCAGTSKAYTAYQW
jgi:hypothetical protein